MKEWLRFLLNGASDGQEQGIVRFTAKRGGTYGRRWSGKSTACLCCAEYNSIQNEDTFNRAAKNPEIG
jgi:hypothetical protein